jgi:hypothetical protein
MDISTPWYTTTKEQYHISHMSIRTPCHTIMKEQIMLIKWISAHHDIFQWKCKIMLVKWIWEQQCYITILVCLYMYCCWRSSYQKRMVGNPLFDLSPQRFVPVPIHDLDFERHFCSVSSVKMRGDCFLLILVKLMTITV